MGDRKTPYKFRKRIGPDIAAAVARFPHKCLVRYLGDWYAYKACSLATCAREYWRRYGGSNGVVLVGKHLHHTYCSENCAREGRRLQARIRRARWVAKNPEKARAAQRRAYQAYLKRQRAVFGPKSKLKSRK